MPKPAWPVRTKSSTISPGISHKTAISNHRLLSANEHSVRFAYRDRAKGSRQRALQLPAAQFLERSVLHVLPRGREESAESKLDKLEALVVTYYGRPKEDVRFIAAMLSIPIEPRHAPITMTAQQFKDETLRALRDSLMARLDRNRAVKEIAQIGAAIGREFSYELIQAIGPKTGAHFDNALQQLTDSGLAFRRGAPPEATYTFKHALVQDVAYDSLLKRRRVRRP
jgi:hypothetical protein